MDIIEQEKADRQILEKYVKLLKATDIIEDQIIKKIKAAHEFDIFVNTTYRESLTNYYRITTNLIRENSK